MKPKNPTVKLPLILFAVCSEFGMPRSLVFSDCRKHRADDVRQAAKYLAKQFGHATAAVAQYFGCSLWSIYNAVKQCRAKMDTEPEYFHHVTEVSTRLMQLTCTPPAERLQHRHD